MQKIRFDLIKKKLGSQAISRFAPSPTGQMHLGHIASALYVWGISQKLNGKVIIRIEDHDRQRSKEIFIKQIIEDLKWLGFLNLVPHTREQKHSYYKQSDCTRRYEKNLSYLTRQKETFLCSCSRKNLLKQRIKNQGEIYYPGTCRFQRKIKDHKEASVRLVVEDDTFEFYDFLKGHSSQTPSKQCGDFLLKDRNQNWTYQFSSTVDDIYDKINLIIRGEDIFHCTGRQIYLMKKLKFSTEELAFVHHPLIYDPETKAKLSKSDLAQPISSFRNKGYTPEDLLGLAAFLVGLKEDKTPLPINALEKLF